MIVATGLNAWFDSMVGEWPEPDGVVQGLYPDFQIRVLVPRFRGPDHEVWEMVLEMGRNTVRRVINGERIRQPEPLFVFPERWLSVIECRHFMSSLCLNPSVKEFGKVRLITQSTVIMSDFPRQLIALATWPDDEEQFSDDAIAQRFDRRAKEVLAEEAKGG